MYSRVFAGMLGILLAMMFMGIALADKENASTTDSIASPQIAITAANFVAPSPEKEHLDEEWVEITNLGTSDINLAGWTLSDAQNHTYTFPDFSLAAGAKVVVRTGKGDDDIENLFWNRSNSIWNNSGDLAVLKDPEGNTVSMYPEESKEA
jgi:hypothetical protein